MTDTEPKIYVACLAAYNAGTLHGDWIDATQDADDIHEDIKTMLAESPEPNAEEWAIHDTDNFGGIDISEYESIETVSEIAQFINNYDDTDLVAEIYNYYDADIETAKTALDDDYCGEYDSERDFAIELFDECYLHEIPEHLRNYIDYDSYARDIFIDGYFSFEINGAAHVFAKT